MQDRVRDVWPAVTKVLGIGDVEMGRLVIVKTA